MPRDSPEISVLATTGPSCYQLIIVFASYSDFLILVSPPVRETVAHIYFGSLRDSPNAFPFHILPLLEPAMDLERSGLRITFSSLHFLHRFLRSRSWSRGPLISSCDDRL